MNTQIVRLVVELTLHEGRLEAFEAIAQQMVAGSQNEPATLGYDWYLSRDRRRCRVLESYSNANAVLAHFTGPVVQQLIPKLLEQAKIDRFEVYGDPGPEAAAMLAGFGAEIFAPSYGLSR